MLLGNGILSRLSPRLELHGFQAKADLGIHLEPQGFTRHTWISKECTLAQF